MAKLILENMGKDRSLLLKYGWRPEDSTGNILVHPKFKNHYFSLHKNGWYHHKQNTNSTRTIVSSEDKDLSTHLKDVHKGK